MGRAGFIYFLQLEDTPGDDLAIVGRGLAGATIRVTRDVGVEPIKIGFTGCLAARIRQHAAESSGVMKFLGAMPGDREIEREIHDRYDGARLRREEAGPDTEVFYPVPELALLIVTLPAFDASGLGLENYRPTPPDVLRARRARKARTAHDLACSLARMASIGTDG